MFIVSPYNNQKLFELKTIAIVKEIRVSVLYHIILISLLKRRCGCE
jgi:hypothetical protein